MKEHFATLKLPKYSAPLPVWYAIGGIYYLVFGFLLYRMFRIEGNPVLPDIIIGYLVFLMFANGSWNYIFFRRKDLYTAFMLGTIAPAFDIGLLVLVVKTDPQAALALIPYLLYRVYAVCWGYGLWKVNR